MSKQQYELPTREEVDKMLPVIMSDMKHNIDPVWKVLNDSNVKRELYAYFIRDMFSEKRFLHREREFDGTNKEGLYIKGYVRGVWEYLEEAYDLVHNRDYSAEIKEYNDSINNNK